MLSFVFQCFVLQYLLWNIESLILQPPCGVCSKTCGAFEERRSCGPTCPMTCETLYSNICCDVKCVSGCFCKDGYILVSNIGPRRCVPLNDCPKPGILDFSTQTVPVFENMKTVMIVVLRMNGTAGTVAVQWHTVEGTARQQSDFIPASGNLEFPEGVSFQTITLEIVEDTIRESDEIFTVVLSDPTNGAEINPRRLEGITVIIKDDDMKPGYVEVETTMIEVNENIGIVNVTLIRVEGTDGQIRIKYRTIDGTARERIDYVPINGEVVFEEEETTKIVSLTIIDDDAREPIENIRLQLFDPSAADDVINFRSLAFRLETTIIIKDNDMTPGYLEFEEVNVTVRENDNKVHISVVRLGGTDGILQLKYKTIDGTATMMSDYQQATGDLVFKDGETRKMISIVVLNDNVRESIETFQLQIYDVTPGSGTINFRSLGTRLTALIQIIDDDERPGYVEMEETTIKVLESCGTVAIPLVRQEGSDGELRVPYKIIDVSAVVGSDYKVPLGEVVFKDGETRKIITVEIVDDQVRELAETFQIQLLDLESQLEQFSFRKVGARRSTVVSITDNDAKPGLVQFERQSITVREDVGVAEIPVIRVDGTDGSLLVKYKAVVGSAISLVDFSIADGDLLFEEGVDRLTIKIRIIDDRIKESDETFNLLIYEPEGIQSRRTGQITSLLVTIIDNDNNPGVFEFQSIRMSVPEYARTLSIGIIRKGGSDGLVTLQIRTKGGSATEGVDYNPPPLTIDFLDGITEQRLHIQILNDDIKENDENFLVGIFSPTNGGKLGEANLLTVVITDDDEPSVIRFRSRTGSFRENDGIAEIPIIRENGLDKRVGVHWKTEEKTAKAGEDYVEVSDSIVIFEPNERAKTIRILILDDSQFESNELFDVVLLNPSSGAVLGVPSRYTVELADNDAKVSSLPSIPNLPNELQIYFSLQSIKVKENAGEVQISIVKSGPLSAVTVRIQTADGSAIGGKDYRRTRGPITFQEDDVEIVIVIRIIDDDLYEQDETFTVELFNPSSGIIPIGLNVVTIIIEDDDGDLELRRKSGALATPNPRPPSRPTPKVDGPFLLTKCPSNLILKPCASTCPPTCGSIFGKAPCSAGGGCIRGCFCPDGLVKESESSERCVKPSQCPSPRPPCNKCAGSSSGGLLVATPR